jgi:hypothetical protein
VERAIGGRAARIGLSTRRAHSLARALCLLAAIGLGLVLAPAALASPSFTWTGKSTVSEKWSSAGNWAGGVAPSTGEAIGALTFPALAACTVGEEEEEEEACTFSFDDLSGLSAESMAVEGDGYFILGASPLTLGAGGLKVVPEAGAGGSSFYLFLPFEIGTTQAWHFPNRAGAKIGENEIQIGEPVTGPVTAALTLDLSNEAEPLLEGGVEAGPLTIAGTDPSEAGVFNGAYPLDDTDVNGEDGQPVNVEHVFVFGTGKVGRLTSNDAELTVGSAGSPAGGIEAAGVRLDSSTSVTFPIVDNGTTPKQDYGQLTSNGPVELQNAALEVLVRPDERGKPCPTLTRGQVYTFVSTTGTLSGAFANAPESGQELGVRVAEGCAPSSQTMRIGYHESGATKTVTGTVEEAAQKGQEAEVQRLAEQRGRQLAEAAAAATAAAKHQEEEAAKQGVLAAKEASPDAAIASTSLQAGPSGAVSITISCPTGVNACAGTVTLRTLGPVRAAARAKPAILALAAGSFTVPGGGVRKITLHLSAKARALLARSHELRVRATILAHNPAGATHTGQRVLLLRAPKVRSAHR